MTVIEKVAEDVGKGATITELPQAPCAICDRPAHLRYGCCIRCAITTNIDDPRLVGYPRIGGKPT